MKFPTEDSQIIFYVKFFATGTEATNSAQGLVSLYSRSSHFAREGKIVPKMLTSETLILAFMDPHVRVL